MENYFADWQSLHALSQAAHSVLSHSVQAVLSHSVHAVLSHSVQFSISVASIALFWFEQQLLHETAPKSTTVLMLIAIRRISFID